jgi:hypothetical protein
MPKLTVFEKKETGSKIDTKTIIVQKDFSEISLFSQEKIKEELCPNEISTQKKFDEYVIQAVDEALTSLGEPVKNTIYFQLENNFKISKNQIPDQIEEFTNIIHKIFGLGASRLEIKFMKNLYSKIKTSVEINECEYPLSNWIIEDMSFTDYIKRTREDYCKCNKNAELLQEKFPVIK